jgi:dimethylargininase
MLIAFTRAVPPSIERCELTHLERTCIDVDRAIAQHDAYESLLARLGCRVQRVAAAPDMPDSVFVEDTAVVLDQIAIVTRPGAPSRQGETEAVAAALGQYRTVHRIQPPATLDGGDVLRVGRRLFIGVTARTSADAVRQVQDIVRPLRYTVESLEVGGCLHLKTAATAASDDLLVLNPAWLDARAFSGFECLAVDPDEPFAGNVLRVGEALVCAAASVRTAERLRSRGFAVHTVDVSELAKAEAGVTCCSLLCYKLE